MIWTDNLTGHPRMGLIVPKHQASAVARNRLRRRLREIWRVELQPLQPAWDLVIRARREAYRATFDQLRGDLLAWRGAVLPSSLPGELIDVYLHDSEAAPLHECEDCGVAIPVKKSRRGGCDEPERAYFPSCPVCGGRTGWYLRHARLAEGHEDFGGELRRAKPR